MAKEECNRCWDVYKSFERIGKLVNSQFYFDGCSYKAEAGVFCMPMILLLQQKRQAAELQSPGETSVNNPTIDTQ